MNFAFARIFALVLSATFCLFLSTGQQLTAQESIATKKFEKYVDGLMKGYDSDKDGLLSADELGKMRRKPYKADTNGDGMISRNELFFSLTGYVLNAEQAEQRHQVYAEHLMKVNDLNSNGSISSEENQRMRRSIPKSFDSNGDNKFSIEEIVASVSRASAPKIGSTGKPTRRPSKEKLQQHPESQHRGKIQVTIRESPKSSSDVSGTREEVEAKALDPTVAVDLYLIRLPKNTGAGRLAKFVNELRNASNDTLAETVESTSTTSGESMVDFLSVVTTSGGTGRTTSASSKVDDRNLDLGFRAEVTPNRFEDFVLLQIEVSKSDFLEDVVKDDNGNEVSMGEVITWEFDSTLHVKNGEPTVVSSSSKGQNWILAVSVR